MEDSEQIIGLSEFSHVEDPLEEVRSSAKRGDQDLPFYEELADLSIPEILSSQTFQAASVCLLKGQHLLLGSKGELPASYEAKENRTQGHLFEQIIFKHPELWLPKLEKALEIPPLENPAIYNCEIPAPKGKSTEEYREFLNQSKNHTKRLLEAHVDADAIRAGKKEQPAIFWQATLGVPGSDQDGRVDFIFYLGNLCWAIADIKRSEECRTTFGIQLYFYRSLLADMLAQPTCLNTTTEEVIKHHIHPLGAVIHYSRGYTWVSKSSKREREICLQNLIVTPIELQLLRREYEALYDSLILAKSPDQTLAQFTNHCVECQFRHHCYHYLIKDRTDLSLVPMDNSLLNILKEEKITSAEQLANIPKNHKILQEAFENQDVIQALLDRAQKATHFKGYSNLVIKPEWKNLAWIFAAHQQDKHTAILWQNPTGEIVESIEEIPDVIVTFSEHEQKLAYLTLQRKFGGEPLVGIEYICLLDSIRTYLHLPLPSYTPKALARFFSLVESGKYPHHLILEWYQKQQNDSPSEYERSEAEFISPTERLLGTASVWRGLLELTNRIQKIH